MNVTLSFTFFVLKISLEPTHKLIVISTVVIFLFKWSNLDQCQISAYRHENDRTYRISNECSWWFVFLAYVNRLTTINCREPLLNCLN